VSVEAVDESHSSKGGAEIGVSRLRSVSVNTNMILRLNQSRQRDFRAIATVIDPSRTSLIGGFTAYPSVGSPCVQ
jgi:hypothetical protein